MEQSRSRGDRYALSALRNKRASIASDIVQLKRRLRHCKDALVHVDATLRLLDPSIEVGAIPTKRPRKRIKLFRQGELGRMILNAMRDAAGPIGTHAIVDAILEAGGHDNRARPSVMPRVRGNLSYLHRRDMIRKLGSGKDARWEIVGR